MSRQRIPDPSGLNPYRPAGLHRPAMGQPVRTSGQGARTTPARISLTIDRLAVHGLGQSEARRFAAALERELGSLFFHRGLPEGFDGSALSLDSASLGRLNLPPGASPDRAGRAVAEALYRDLCNSAAGAGS